MLLIAYDGTGFSGFAPQPGRRTVGGTVAAALAAMFGGPVSLTCAGRTDAGVHAEGQVAHVDLPVPGSGAGADPFDARGASRFAKSLTRQLGPEIAVLDARRAPPGFDARRSAISRRYGYDILTGAVASPLVARVSWHVPYELDLSAMRIAADTLLGSHDFAAFCKRARTTQAGDAAAPEPLVRRVLDTAFLPGAGRQARLLRFEIEANAFCHHMVRSLVGALVSVGRGLLTPAELLSLVRTADRQAASRRVRPAPAAGLTLCHVRYPPELIGSSDGVWHGPP